MGLIYTDITLSNPASSSILPIHVQALADTGSITLCISEHIALQLSLTELEKREVTTADGKKHLCSYMGPVQVQFQNRSCFTGALVIGDDVLLGAIPMEDMDLILDPASRRVVVNPESPNIPSAIVK